MSESERERGRAFLAGLWFGGTVGCFFGVGVGFALAVALSRCGGQL